MGSGRSRVLDVDFSPVGGELALALAGGTTQVVDAKTRHLRLRLRPPDASGTTTGDVNSARFSPRGRTLVTASDDGFARIWDVRHGRLRAILPASKSFLAAADFSADDKRVMTAGLDGRLKVWSVRLGNKGPLQLHPSLTLTSPGGQLFTGRFAGKNQMVTGGNDGLVHLWGLGSSDVIHALRHRSSVQTAAYSPDGSTIVSGDADGAVHSWSADGGRQLLPPLRYANRGGRTIWGVGVGRNGQDIAAAGDRGIVKIWDTSGRPTEVLTQPAHASGGQSWLDALAMAPNGHSVAAAGFHGWVWQTARPRTPVPLRPLPHGASSIAFSPDGQLVATGGWDGKVRLWRPSDGTEVGVIDAQTNAVTSVAFSPDGALIAAGTDDDRSARVWDVESRDLIAVMRGHSATVSGVAFSPDGDRLATGSYDQTVRIWDIPSEELLATLHGPTDSVYSVAYSPDGSRIVAGARDNTAYVLRCGSCQPYAALLALARERIRSFLTPAERAAYAREADLEQ